MKDLQLCVAKFKKDNLNHCFSFYYICVIFSILNHSVFVFCLYEWFFTFECSYMHFLFSLSLPYFVYNCFQRFFGYHRRAFFEEKNWLSLPPLQPLLSAKTTWPWSSCRLSCHWPYCSGSKQNYTPSTHHHPRTATSKSKPPHKMRTSKSSAKRETLPRNSCLSLPRVEAPKWGDLLLSMDVI